MTDEPVLDGRTDEQILSQIREIAPYYVESWDPDRPDAGTALLEIFADMSEDVIERLDRVPEKQRAAFLDSLGFNNRPPQPSKLPVTFTVDENATGNVDVPVGTTVESIETDDREAQQFETVGESKFVATPASITDTFGVDPGTDRIVDHWPTLDRGDATTLFTGENEQHHALYLGDSELLQLAPGSTVELTLSTNATLEAIRDYLEWEYFGENEAGDEGWHPLVVHERSDPDPPTLSAFDQVTSFLDRLESFLAREGYQFASEQGPSDLLVRSLADDIRKGRFGEPDESSPESALPPGLFTSTDVPDSVVRKIQHQLATLRERLQGAVLGHEFTESFETVALAVDIPGEITEREIDGVPSRWIRAKVPEDELSHALFNVLVEDVKLSVGSSTSASSNELTLDEAVANDVTLDLDAESALLLGENPTGEATFLFTCREAFTKPGAMVTLTFEHAAENPTAEHDPELNWEYWNGTGWRRLLVEDETNSLQTSGTVTFEVPADMEPTTEQGQESLWIQARLVGGDYGQPQMVEVEKNNWERVTDHISPPDYRQITVSYDRSSIPLDHCVTENNVSFDHVAPGESEVQPFRSPPGPTQAIYLGFDHPLEGGPVNLYLPIQGAVYPDGFTPWIDVEYCTDPRNDQWRRVDLRDGTEDLTELGILQLTFPEPTTEFTLFGRDRHWIRVRVTDDEFTRTEENAFVSAADIDAAGARHRELAYQSVAARERRNRTRSPPVLDGLYLNTQWARNFETITDQIIGSATGTADQRLDIPNEPVLNATVWIDESDARSEREIDRLLDDDSITVEVEREDDGRLTALWVRWTAVEDFFESPSSARHYVLDETNGRLVFGNGKAGMIPPEGENNVRVTYQTGGGDDGDIPAETVDSLLDPVPSIEAVTNPEPGETGEDVESLAELVTRAPKKLRDRGKPITRDGFRRIALSASQEIERVKCRAGEDEAGAPGKVTLLVVPDMDVRKPVPADDLIKHVEDEMQERAPAAVVDGEASNVTVRGPHYVEVSVSATVESAGVQSASDVTDRAESVLAAFAHPLTGGPDGEGWEIGSVPPPTVFAARLEQLDIVERVTNLAVTFTDGEQELTLAGSEEAPRVSADVLIYSGRHDVSVAIGDTQ